MIPAAVKAELVSGFLPRDGPQASPMVRRNTSSLLRAAAVHPDGGERARVDQGRGDAPAVQGNDEALERVSSAACDGIFPGELRHGIA